MSNKKVVVSGIITVAVLAVITKLSGLFREAGVASQFGTSAQMDLFSVLSVYVGMMVSFMAFSSSTSYLPVFVGDVSKRGLDYASRQFSHFLNQFAVVNIIICTIIIIFASVLADFLSTNINGIDQTVATLYIRIISLTILTDGIIRLLITALNGIRQYGWLQKTQILFNLITIFFVLAFSDKYGVGALIAAYVFNSSLQLMLLIYVCWKNGMRYDFCLHFRNKTTISIWKSVIPVFLGSETYILGLAIDRSIGVSLGQEGYASALNYSAMLYGLVNSIISIPIVTVLYTELSQAFKDNGIDGLDNSSKKINNAINAIMIPLCAFLFIEASDFVCIVLQRGAFDGHSTTLTTIVFQVYVLICPVLAIRTMLSRTVIILNKNTILTICGLVFLATNILVSWLLSKVIGLQGIPIGAFAATALSLLYMLISIKKQVGINCQIITSSFLKVLISVLVATGLCLLLREVIHLAPFVNFFLLAAVFFISYLVVLNFTKCSELLEVEKIIINSNYFNRLFKKKSR